MYGICHTAMHNIKSYDLVMYEIRDKTVHVNLFFFKSCMQKIKQNSLNVNAYNTIKSQKEHKQTSTAL